MKGCTRRRQCLACGTGVEVGGEGWTMFREEEVVQEDEGAARKRSREEVKIETNNPKRKTYFFGLSFREKLCLN